MELTGLLKARQVARRITLLASIVCATMACASEPLVQPGGCTLEGQFSPQVVPPGIQWADPRNARLPHFSSYDPDGANTGAMRTGRFQAPARLRLFVSGYPGAPGIRLYLEDVDRPRTLDLFSRLQPGFYWQLREWSLPADWRGANVRLVAEDHSNESWIGVTLPESGGDSFAFSLFRSLYRSGLCAVVGLFFLLPGTAIALSLKSVQRLEAFQLISVILTASAGTAYLIFWAWFWSPQWGRAFTAALLFQAILTIALSLRRVSIPRKTMRETAACFGLVTLVAAFYCASGFLFLSSDEAAEQAEVRFVSGPLPADNLLQKMLAERLYAGDPVKPFLFADWKSSDRPPLETGAVLWESAFWSVIGRSLHYQLLCVWLQCIWVAAIWVLLRSAGFGSRYLTPVLGFAIASDFCWLHSFFVWPKLMAAAFLLISLALFPIVRRRTPGAKPEWTAFDACLAAAAAGAALMSHAGVAFTLIALLAFALIRRELPWGRKAVAALAMAALFLVPWQLYQKLYDPPGDQLLKLHLLGGMYPNLSFGAAFHAAFKGYTVQKFVSSRMTNIATLAGHPLEILRARDAKAFFHSLTQETFFSLLLTVGILNLGFAARFFAPRTAAVRLADRLLALAALSLAVWILLMYTPGGAVVHQGSFATVLLLFVSLAIYLAEAWPRVTPWLIGLQASILPLFVLAKPFLEEAPGSVRDSPLDPGMAVVALLSLAALAVCGWRSSREVP